MPDTIVNIAIDGPVGAGKSTVADEVARRLNILHLDTGAMYRALALRVLALGIDPRDEATVSGLCADAALRVEVAFENGMQRTLLNDEDVSGLIRTQEAGLAASTISRYRPVREWLVARQRQIACTQSMVLDGRDIGTVVLPDAKVKVYLTATPEERARRRHQQLLEAGQVAVYQDVLEQLKTRDLQDQTRAVDPLRPARGAVMLDTTHLSFEQTVQTILDLVALA